MKKQLSEPDFIGGQGSLTNEEEVALAQHFAKKKAKTGKKVPSSLGKTNYTKQL